MSNSSSQDFGIPILTEVIQTPPRVAPVAEEHDDAISAHAAEAETTPAVHQPIDGWLDEEWSRLEQKVSERVLTQLLERIEPVLEQRIKDSLAQVMQLAAEGIKQDLHQTLAEAISDAVAQEVDKLNFSNK